jgi:hypothetical protein
VVFGRGELVLAVVAASSWNRIQRRGLMPKPQTCPECNISMEAGVTVDLESRRTQTWLRGPVEIKRLMGIKTRGKELLPVVSYRCPQCGYLKTFAPPI